jgi:diguanylate cyclase (GGDEF)-like protein
MAHGPGVGAAPAVAVDGPLSSRPLGARVGTCAVYALAMAVCAIVALQDVRNGWPTDRPTSHWVLLAGLALAGAVAVVDVVPWWQPQSARRPDGTVPQAGTFVDIADLFFVAAALLLGPVGATVVSLPSFVVDAWLHPTRPYKTLYNVSAYVIGGAVTWWTFHGLLDALGVGATEIARPGWILAAVLAALVFEVVNLVACTFARWTMHGLATPVTELLPLFPVWTETSACMLAVVLAALWRAGPWLVTLGVVPLLILRQGLYLRDLQLASRTDAKTGLYNVPRFTELAEREVRRALRQDGPLALLVADLDHLRHLNGAYGHLAGDVVLKGVASTLRDQVREFDIVCRFGGEEFLVLLPGTDVAEAAHTADRLRQAVAQEVFRATTTEVPLRATISVGVACLRRHAVTLEELLHAADVALYRAKSDGRNRVRVAVERGGLLSQHLPLPDLPLADLPLSDLPAPEPGPAAPSPPARA